MGASWRELHAALRTFATTSRAAAQFEAARVAEPDLGRFESPTALIAYLETEIDDTAVLDDKDQIYAALIRGVQDRATWTELAHTIIWCGLWRGLNRGYRRRAPRMPAERRDELAAMISTQLVRLTGRLDLGNVTRVAATLAHSTLRETTREYGREQRETWIWSGRPFPEHRGEKPQKSGAGLSESSRRMLERAREAVTLRALPEDVGAQVGTTFEAAYEALRRRLLPSLHDDTDLVLGVLVLKESHREVAERHGLSPDTVRKRFERALPLLPPFLLHFPPFHESRGSDDE